MKLCIVTECGSIEMTGVDEEVVAEFVNTYRNGAERVVYVPDIDPTVQNYVTRDYIVRVGVGPDALPEEPPVDLPTPEESGAS